MPARPFYTAEMVRAIPNDGNRYETVHGELLVTPAPRMAHQVVLSRLFRMLDRYLEANGLASPLWSPADISWGPGTLVQPDLFVVDSGELTHAEKWSEIQTLLLAIEVVSPSSRHADHVTKRRLYQEQGIPVYWIVDNDQQQVEIWTPEAHFPVVERVELTWQHPALSESCTIDLPKLFTFPGNHSA